MATMDELLSTSPGNGTHSLLTKHSFVQNMAVIKEVITKIHESCRDLNNLNTVQEKCNFVSNESVCDYDGIVYSYTEMTYCWLDGLIPLALFLLGLILLVFFVTISIVADDFLCPSLLTISKTLRLPDNIAGATFLAFGNGAPDIFSSIGGISKAKSSLIFSSLFGGGIFVTCVVTGSVLLTGPFNVMKRPILRDIVFYIGASFIVWIFIFHSRIALAQSLSLIFYYLFYLVVLVASRFIYLRTLKTSTDGDLDYTVNCDTEGDNRSLKSIQSGKSTHEPGSRKQSITSYLSLRLSHDARDRNYSFDDDVILTRFHQRAVVNRRRTISRSNQQPHATHHHFSNAINHIGKVYEAQLRKGVVEDIRYQDTIENENKNVSGPREKLPKPGAHSNEIKFTNNFGKPKYLQQFSNMSATSSKHFLKVMSEAKQLLIHVCPIDIYEWNQYGLFKKIVELIKAVPYLLLTLCIPVVDLDSQNENWCRLLICINMLIAPQVMLAFLNIEQWIGPLPLWFICVLVSIALCIIILLTSEQDKPPIYHRVFSFVGFGFSIIVTNTVVNEIIAVLEAFGVIFNLTDSILGLTILAWGNSLGDIIADLSLARHGYPGMAIAACFGSPMLNLLMGLGIPYSVLFIKGQKTEVNVKHSSMIILLYTTITLSLVISLFGFILNRFKSSKVHGIMLICLYVVYMALAMMIEFEVIPSVAP